MTQAMGTSIRGSTPLLNPSASLPKMKRSESIVKRNGQRSVVLLEDEAAGSKLNDLAPSVVPPPTSVPPPAKLNPREMAEIRSLFKRGVLNGPLCGVDGVVTALDMLHIAVPLRQVVPIALAAQVQGRAITQELLVEIVKEVKAKYLNQLPRSFADDVMDGFRGLDALLPPPLPSSDDDDDDDGRSDIVPVVASTDPKLSSVPTSSNDASNAPQQDSQATKPVETKETPELRKGDILMQSLLSEEHFERYLDEERYLRSILEEKDASERDADRRRRKLQNESLRQQATTPGSSAQQLQGQGESLWTTSTVSVDRVDEAIRSAFDLPYSVFRPDTAPTAIRLASWRQGLAEPSKNSSSSGTASPTRGSFFMRRSGSLPPNSFQESNSPVSNAPTTLVSPVRPDLSPTASTTRSPDEIRPVDSLWRLLGGSDDPSELDSKVELPLALFGEGTEDLSVSTEVMHGKPTKKGTPSARSSRYLHGSDHSTDTPAGSVPSALRRLQSKMGSYLLLAATLRSNASRSEGPGPGAGADDASASFILPDEEVNRSESGDSEMSGAPPPKATDSSGLRFEPPLASKVADNTSEQASRKHRTGTPNAEELVQRKNRELNALYLKILARKEREATKKREDLERLHDSSKFGATGPGAVLLAVMSPAERSRLGGLAVHPESYLRNGNKDIYCTGLRQAQQKKRLRNAKDAEEKRKLDLEILRLQAERNAAQRDQLTKDLREFQDHSSTNRKKTLRFSFEDTPNHSQHNLPPRGRTHKNDVEATGELSGSNRSESPFLYQSISFAPEGEDGEFDDDLLQLASGLAGHGLKHRCKESTAVKRTPLKEFSCRFTSEGVREPKLAQALRAECDLAVAKISQDSAGKHKRLGQPQRTYLLKL
jgi:hypothetical protein